MYVDINRNETLFYSIYVTFYFIKQPYILSILVVLTVYYEAASKPYGAYIYVIPLTSVVIE